MPKLSVVIITLNEEKNLGRCLDSVREIADEIVVVDSFSTDNTAAIARRYNARVIQQPFEGYGQQKNFATQQAANDWILSLDADEALSPELKQNITEVLRNPQHNAYLLPRLTNYCGKWIHHCGWYPDKKLRLYNRTKGAWNTLKVHEYWQSNNSEEKTGTLKGDLLHYSYYSLTGHLKQINKYTDLAAHEAAENGKTCSLLKIWLAPKWNFFANYILRLGFLDGYAGYVVCKMSAFTVFIKYAKTRQMSTPAPKGE